MEFLGEFLTYAFKYVVLGAIAIAGVMCAVKSKKKQQETTLEEQKTTQE